MLPDKTLDVLRKSLAGKTLVEIDAAFNIDRAVSHGHVAAVHKMAYQLRFDELLGPRHRKRDLAYALIVARVLAPQCVLPTIRWWADTSLCADLDITAADIDEVYAAMDWLACRQETIERKLAKRHLTSGGTGLFDLSTTWLEAGRHGGDERGLPRIEFGVLGDAAGCPVAVRVLSGDIGDTRPFPDAVSAVRDRFGLRNLIMTGRHGMITRARVGEMPTWPRADWITELRPLAVIALAGPDGPLPHSLSGAMKVADIASDTFPGQRLVCWCDAGLADERARMRHTLLLATEQELDAIVASVAAGRLHGAERIGVRAARAVHRNRVGRLFTTTVTDTEFSYRRDVERIVAEAAVDGLRVIRTNVDRATLTAEDVVDKYENFAHIEREFGPIGSEDLEPHSTDRIRAHFLLGLLASYLNWHLRRVLAPLIVTDASMSRHDRDSEPEPEYDYPGLIAHLGQLTRNTVTFAGQRFAKMTSPTSVQRRAFELLDEPNPPPWVEDG